MTLKQWNKVIGVNHRGNSGARREAAQESKRRGVRPDVPRRRGRDHLHQLCHEAIPGGRCGERRSVERRCDAHDEASRGSCAVSHPRDSSPGAIRTPINMEAWGMLEAYHEPPKFIPYKRIGEPEEIGRAVGSRPTTRTTCTASACSWMEG